MAVLSFEIDNTLISKLVDEYQNYQDDNLNPYIIFFARKQKCSISIYQSKKGFKVVFSGEEASIEASKFNFVLDEENVKQDKEADHYIDLNPQIGSDEVGFGDFFGPIVVCASYFDDSFLEFIDRIKDSKKMTDEAILSFVPTIINKVTYSLLVVDNLKLNELLAKGFNLNQIKAILHNKALLNLSKKVKYQNAYIDQFCLEKTYFQYLNKEKEVLKNITFHTKGETYYPSVALASLLARYTFLHKMEELNNKYDFVFPIGASKKVDDAFLEFIKSHSQEECLKVCKSNFRNYKDIFNKD